MLSTNYRNTVEIVEFAGGLVAGDSFVDIEGTDAVADGYSVSRHGPAPVLWRASTSSASGGARAAHDAAVVERIRDVLRMPGVEAGDVGVLARSVRDVEETLRVLAAAGIPAMNLSEYRGEQTPRIRVGTIKRAKGLEFKQVLVVRAPRSVLRATQADGERSERDTLAARELYVAMTHARDGLWVAVG